MKASDMAKMNVKFVIFDWSGTISDDMDACFNAAIKIRRHFGLPMPSKAEWRKQTMSNAIDYLREQGVAEEDDEILRIYSRFYAESPVRPKPFSDSEDVFVDLASRGKKILVVSGHPTEHLQAEMEEYGFGRFIESCWGSTKNKAKKLKEIIADLDVDPSDVVYVGDMVWDVRAAKDAGIRSVAVLRGYHSEDRLMEEKPDIAIKSLTELKEHII